MKKNTKILFWLAFIIYILLLIKMTLVRVPLDNLKYAITHLSLAGIFDRLKAAQYIPFKTIIYHYNHSVVKDMITSFGWLMLWMIPMGYFLPMLTRQKRLGNLVVIGLLIGLFIEVCQLILNVAAFNIDDVLLSGFGVLLGYALYKISRY